MLEIEGVETFYGRIKVLMGLSMTMRGGELVAVLGANGAGKSTLLKTIMGITPAEYGSIRFLGTRIETLDTDVITRLGMAMVPEGRLLFGDLTVKENLAMGAYIRSDERGIRQDQEKMFHYFPVLKERLAQKAGLLSGGEQQMLVIARALMSRPRLLLLDEPSLGLFPLLVGEIFKIIREIHKAGTAVLVVEQNFQMALGIADFVYIMENGRMRVSGKPDQVLADQDVREFYLGEGKGKYGSRQDRWKGRM